MEAETRLYYDLDEDIFTQHLFDEILQYFSVNYILQYFSVNYIFP